MFKASTRFVTGTLIAALIALASMPAAAQETVLSLTRVAEIDLSAKDMEFASPHLYLLTDAGVEVYDLSDPTAPQKVAAYETDAKLADLAVQGERLYAVGGNTLYVLDVSKPVSPTQIIQMEVQSFRTAQAVAADESAVYVLAGACTLFAIDPADWSMQSTEPIQTSCGDSIAIVGRWLYFTMTPAGSSHGCCASLRRVEVGPDGELSVPRHVERFRIWARLTAAPDGVVFVTSTQDDDGVTPCIYPGVGTVQSFQSSDDEPEVSAPRLYLSACDTSYSTLAATADHLYLGNDWLAVHTRTAPQQETFLTSFRPRSVIRRIVPAGDLVILRTENVTVLRWIETPTTDRLFFPDVSREDFARH